MLLELAVFRCNVFLIFDKGAWDPSHYISPNKRLGELMGGVVLRRNAIHFFFKQNKWFWLGEVI